MGKLLKPTVKPTSDRVLHRRNVEICVPMLCRVRLTVQKWSDDPPSQRWLIDGVSTVEPATRVSVQAVVDLLTTDVDADLQQQADKGKDL